MNTTAQFIPYSSTGFFSTIISDYISGNELLKSFYSYPVSIDGIKLAIEDRKKFTTNRKVLTEVLNEQYADQNISIQQQTNIHQLNNENCFTITTAHQPNIFTGHLYFIYKILHTIKLAEELQQQIPGNHFVPVYYMGSEDADLEELGEVTIDGKKYIWETTQTGAVGRMKIDKSFLTMIDAIDAQLSVEPHGNEIISLVRKSYTLTKTIEQATFELVNELFAAYGLLILLPDNALLKKEFAHIITKELKEQFSQKAVSETISSFPAAYKVQAAGRETNLFYLEENSRERIEKLNSHWSIVNSTVKFDEHSIFEELEKYPERFSPNVILRPVFQELILPNIIFIGGGGEVAYWMQLKKVFEAVAVPYPVIILRNSFMIVPKKAAEKIKALNMTVVDFFKPTTLLMEQIVKKHSAVQLNFSGEKNKLAELYTAIQETAAAADASLLHHVEALHIQAAKKITQLEKKIYKAEKKKFEAQQRQVEKIKDLLFPAGNLQERIDNIMPYYASYGRSFIDTLYKHSLTLQQEFTILTDAE